MAPLAGLLLGLLFCAVAVSAQPGPLWAPLNEGQASVRTGADLLSALEQNVGNISLAGDIHLKPSDWQAFPLPINISSVNRTVLVSGGPAKHVLDWGGAIHLLFVAANATLAFDSLSLQHPGNRTRGVETSDVVINGVPTWPTVFGASGHAAVLSDSDVQLDNRNCNPEFVQIEVGRIQQQLLQLLGERGEGLVGYGGDVSIRYVYMPFPAPLISLITRQQIGTAEYTLSNITTTCYDSAAPSTDNDGSSTAALVGAVVGTVAGCTLLVAAGGAFLWRRKRLRRLQARQGGAQDEERMSKQESGNELASQPSDKLPPAEQQLSCGGQWGGTGVSSSGGQWGGTGLSSGVGSELQSPFLRTRFGPIDGVQLGELLGRGAYGRVYKGRWKGAIVAVKVVDHRVGPGKTHDLSREPLLSMSVSHPNVVITHKMCVVRVLPAAGLEGSEDAEEAQQQAQAGEPGGLSGASGGSSGSGAGRLVPSPDGSSLVELVSPRDVLHPGMYETWLITELCDRGSLAELVHGGRMGGVDAAQRPVWALLCLLDVAQGLEYLHSSTIIHGDLKPANVLLKAARNDRRGFVCKLGDFGLSRMLNADQSHVETQSFGTASYAAPELLSQGKLTKAADIYSLGMIMWEVMSEQEPYPELTAMQIILQVSQHGARPDVPEPCPPGLADLMQRCWHQDPAQRPDAEQVVGELRQLLAAARPPPPPALPPRTPGDLATGESAV